MSGETSKKESHDFELLVVRFKRLMRHVWKHFREDRLFEEAASLSFTSLLALVPLLAVIFGVISVFPVFSEWSGQFQDFVFENFVPSAGATVQTYMDSFLESVSGLTLLGTVFLIVTALLLMFRIEVAFNMIWRVTEQRSLTNRVVMYWAVLTLSPIMIGAAVALGAQNVLGALHLDEGVSPALESFGVFLLMWMAFSLIFVLVPNRKVQIRDAIAGAFLTAVLFEIAKAAFLAYVTNANYTMIYGAMATVPIFLLWLYLVWTVVLFGASLAASLTTFQDLSRSDVEWPRKLILQLAFRVVGHLWQAQRRGQGVYVEKLLELEKQVSEEQLRELLIRLRDADVVSHHPDDGWRLNRDLEDLTFGGLQSAGEFYLPLNEIDLCVTGGPWDAAFQESLRVIRNRGEDALITPLRRMYHEL